MKTPPIRVLVVDDSAFNRKVISEMLASEAPRIQVAGTAYDGQVAIRRILDLKPDVVTLDLEMPVMDGFSTLRWIQANRPTPVIVVSSHASDANVFKALDMGAVDFIAKPTRRASQELKDIREDLVAKVCAAVNAHLAGPVSKPAPPPPPKPVELEELPPAWDADVVLVGSSTGGPTVLQKIFSAFPKNLPVSVLVAQHMPPLFTTLFADRLNRSCAIRVREAVDGEPIQSGYAYIAPGGFQMTVAPRPSEREPFQLHVSPRGVNDRFAPSINLLFQSAAQVFGMNRRMLGVVLTGMGGDGREGAAALRKAGGQTLVESPETATLATMPEELIKANLADAVCATEALPSEILRRCRRS
jgi:two-component system chemotaxis response regulator CheB